MNIIKNLEEIGKKLDLVPARYSIPRSKYHLPEIIAVTKTHSRDKIIPLLEYGHRLFGENKIQEAQEKWPELKARYPDIKLHFIGPLQSNKVRDAVTLFDVIQTVDREKIANKLAEEVKDQQKNGQFFIQVNTGEEQQKSGVLPHIADEFINYCRNDLGLDVIGLMCVPPLKEEAALHFGLLKNIAERNNLQALSMGMSNDYEVAAAIGASFIRIGTKIFGSRK